MITKVRLKNWKSHLQSEFNFSSGVNGLIGIMGSGKTSVMDAICFALFGTFPVLQSRKVTLDDLIMKKPQAKERAEIELEFKANGNTYHIKRVLESDKGTTFAEIRENGKLLDVNPEGVTQQVERILQIDYDLFSRAIYSEQNELDYFLRIPKGRRMQQIDRMLKVDRFELVRQNAVAIANKIKQKREEKLRIVSDLEKEGIEEKISEIKLELKDLIEKAAKLKPKLEQTKRKISIISAKISLFEDKEKELNELKQNLEVTKAYLKEISESVKEKTKRIKGLKLKGVERKVKELEKDIKNLSNKLEKEENELREGRDEVASLNTEIRLILASIKDLEKIKAKCPLCESKITSIRRKKLIESKRQNEKILRKKVNQIATDLEKIGKGKDSLEKELRSKELERERINSILSEIKEIENLEKKKIEYNKRKEKFELEKNKLQAELEKIKISELRKNLQEKIAKESEISTKLENFEERLKDKEEVLEDLENRSNMLKKYREETRKDEKIIESLNTFTKVLNITQDQLRQEFLTTVNSIMSRIWNDLYPYRDFSEIKLTIDKDYILQLKGIYGWISVEGGVSGGERSLACLALRIAFSLAFIPNLRWLILDEPTHNLDAAAIRNFSQILHDRIDKFAEQVFLITHEERISDYISGSLYKLTRNKEMNEPTQVVEI